MLYALALQKMVGCLLLEERMGFQLVNGKLHLIVQKKVLQAFIGETCHTDGTDKPFFIKLLADPPCSIIITVWLVQQIEVDILQTKFPHRKLKSTERIFNFIVLHPQFGGNEKLLAFNAAMPDGVSQLLFVEIRSVRSFSASDDFQGILMNLSETFITSIAIRSNYGIIGHLSRLRNPVMKLSEQDFRICETALKYLRMRMEDDKHLFREELLGSLLTAHILDLYNIHARSHKNLQVSERVALLLQKFIELLNNGEYIRNRNLDFYASRLCITPHYLSEICKKVSGKPASYWVDRFTIQEITRLLRQKGLSLTEIAEQMNFSSVSYFSRYVQKRINLSPSEYRRNC